MKIIKITAAIIGAVALAIAGLFAFGDQDISPNDRWAEYIRREERRERP